MPIDLTPTPAPALTAYYGTYDRFKAEVGADNIDTLANIDSDDNPTTIANSKQSAMTTADDMINAALIKAGFTAPTLQNLTILVTIWAKFAAYQLYQLRGVDEAKDNYYTVKQDWAKNELRELIFGNRGGFATTASAVPFVSRRSSY